MNNGREVVVLSGVRTAIGDYGGALKDIAPTELAGQVVKEAVSRAKIDPKSGETRLWRVLEVVEEPEDFFKQISLKDALKTSIEDLDGTFSFLVSTKDEIGYAKDKLAAKPMVKYEDDKIIAIASEEVSLNRLFPGRALNTAEPAPGTYDTWQRSISA